MYAMLARRTSLGDASSSAAVQRMLASRNAIRARLEAFPDFRIVSDEEAQAALASSQAWIVQNQSALDKFFAWATDSTPVPAELIRQLTRDQAQTLILSYYFYGASGSGIYETGLAQQNVSDGTWTQEFIDTDLANRQDLFDQLAKWDLDGVYDRAFGPPALSGFGNPIVIGVVVVACFLIAACAVAYIQTHKDSETQKDLKNVIDEQCKRLNAEGKSEECNALITASLGPAANKTPVDVLDNAAKYLAIAIGAYLFATYGLPKLLEGMDERNRKRSAYGQQLPSGS
jgi:hypothetical protein